MKTRIVLILMTLLCAAMASVQSAHGAIITVTNINDSGLGSLRQALVDANDGDTINFDSSLNGQKITLTSGQLNVDKDITISGPGANYLGVDGNAQSRVFYVNPGTTVALSGLTIANGHVTEGGGVLNLTGALTLSDCIISGNSAYIGGGIDSVGRNGSATLTVTNCTVSGNSADAYGGGINAVGFNGNATATISNSTVSGNSGGGISNSADNGGTVLTVSNSTISGNSAEFGGGISNFVAGNFSAADPAVTSSTLSGNSATGNGGGIYNGQQGGVATLELGSTILNAGASGENIFNVGGTVTSLGYNLSSDDGAGYLAGPGDQINTDPLLRPLQDNGGPTYTHALSPGSPAIDTGDPKFTPPPFYDQRGPGFDRVVNGRIDIGSFEVQGPTPTPTPRPSPRPRPRPTPHPRLTP